jgi:hypothetical protein
MENWRGGMFNFAQGQENEPPSVSLILTIVTM